MFKFIYKYILITAIFFSSNTASAQKFLLVDSLFASDSIKNAMFGSTVVMQDSFAYVGSENNFYNAIGADSIRQAGAVYVFVRNAAGNWSQKQKIVASDRHLNVNFGHRIDVKGNKMVISAIADYYKNLTDSMTQAGSVYFFEKNSSGIWVEKQKIFASIPDTFANFGSAVSLSGNYLCVGAKGEDFDSSGGNRMTDAGAVYMYELNGLGVWEFKQKMNAARRLLSYADFGYSVYLNDTVLFVGQPFTGTYYLSQPGRVNVFARNSSGTWVRRQEIRDSTDSIRDLFGYSLFANDTMLVIGAPEEGYTTTGYSYYFGAAFIYLKNSSGNWIKKQEIGGSREAGTALAFWDNNIFVGCPGGSYAADVYPSVDMYSINSTGSWTRKQSLRTTPYGISSAARSIAVQSGVLCTPTEYWGTDLGTNFVFQYCDMDTTILLRNECDSFSYNGNKYKTSGTYYHVFKDGIKCDSVVKLVLTINYFKTKIIKDTTCDSITINGVTYDTTGIYNQKLSTTKGCDSLLTINLLVRKSSTAKIVSNVCDSFVFNKKSYFASGVYYDTLVNKAKCDSFVTLDLSITKTKDTTIIDTACGEYILNSTKYTSSGLYKQSLKTMKGCDSFINLNVTIYRSENVTIYNSACKEFRFHDSVYTVGGVYKHKFTNIEGCDSIETLVLTFLDPPVSVWQSGSMLTVKELGYSYQWIDCITGLPILGEDKRSFTPNTSGSYAVIVGNGGCFDTSICYDVVGLKISTTNKSENKIQVAPNPVQNNLNIEGLQEGSALVMYDITGKVLLSEIANSSEHNINFQKFSSGIYFLKARDKTGTINLIKVIK